jgi:hypothetical protein
MPPNPEEDFVRRLLTCLALLCATPAHAQFTVHYHGTQDAGGKDMRCTAQFSVEKGRVAVVMKGAHASRMLFLEKDKVLRLVDDDGKTYVDLDQKTLSATGGGDAMSQMEQQMAKMTPEQREQTEKMMQGMMAAVKAPEPDRYVWSQEKQTVHGYECTRVDVMQGDVKRAEYWGTPSPDFKMKDEEHATMLAMQAYLRDQVIQVIPGSGEGARAFQWDTSVDGYPLISRCFHGDHATLDLQYESLDHAPLASDLFKVAGYKKQEFGGAASKGSKKHGH